MKQDFSFLKNFFDIFFIGLLLNSCHIIQMLIAPIGLEKTLSGSQIEFSQKKTHSLNGFKTFFSHFSTEFLVFASF